MLPLPGPKGRAGCLTLVQGREGLRPGHVTEQLRPLSGPSSPRGLPGTPLMSPPALTVPSARHPDPESHSPESCLPLRIAPHERSGFVRKQVIPTTDRSRTMG